VPRSTANALGYGFHAVDAILTNDISRVAEIVVDQSRPSNRQKSLVAKARQAGLDVRFIDRDEIDRLCRGGNHQGIVAIFRERGGSVATSLHDVLEKLEESVDALVLVLDQVQDPHNLGACLRTAECAGVSAVILPRDGSCPVNDTVRKVASGAAERLDIVYVTNLVSALDQLQQANFWAYGTTDQADISIYDSKFTGKVALVMGSEGSGLRRLTMEKCDHLLAIPMRGEVSSLNVSVATGICLFEIRRQLG
jgi:23S rRNA (guanosine2251-2'-O)-methyltransferase